MPYFLNASKIKSSPAPIPLAASPSETDHPGASASPVGLSSSVIHLSFSDLWLVHFCTGGIGFSCPLRAKNTPAFLIIPPYWLAAIPKLDNERYLILV